MPPKDMETHNNLLLLRVMKELGCPLWYALRYPLWNTTDSTATDLPLWTVISQQTRLKSISDFTSPPIKTRVSLLNNYFISNRSVVSRKLVYSTQTISRWSTGRTVKSTRNR